MTEAIEKRMRRQGKPPAGSRELTPAPRYEPSDREAAAVEVYSTRALSAPPLPNLKFEPSRGLYVDHADEATGSRLLLAASGFSSFAAFDSALNHLINMGPADDPASIERLASGAKAQRVFLKLLRMFTEQGRHVSHATGPAYAPARFAEHPDAEGVTKRALASAMEVLMRDGKLESAEHGPPSRRRLHLVEVADDG